MTENRTYEPPKVRELGSVEDVTQGTIVAGAPDNTLFILVSP